MEKGEELAGLQPVLKRVALRRTWYRIMSNASLLWLFSTVSKASVFPASGIVLLALY